MANTTKETLWTILDLFEKHSVTYWLDGGWGVDALYGKQTREHRDIDINFDSEKTDEIITALKYTLLPFIYSPNEKERA